MPLWICVDASVSVSIEGVLPRAPGLTRCTLGEVVLEGFWGVIKSTPFTEVLMLEFLS